MVWRKGDTLQGGKYIIEEVLGHGGFGITYKAWHGELQEWVVIKTPNKYQKKDSEYNKYVNSFKKEGRLLAKFSKNPHPNIVRVRDLFKDSNTYCLLMDFVEGETLFELVKRRGRIPEAEAVAYIRQIGEALTRVHKKGLVHRDLHPGNIIIKTDGQAILIDFGIAQEIIPSTQSTTGVAGNPSFAPYEQLYKGSREPNADIYTLAATLYYILTAEKPTDSMSRRLDNRPLISPRKICSELSPQIEVFILKGLALEANQRPQTIVEWLAFYQVKSQEKPQSPDKIQSQSSLSKKNPSLKFKKILIFLPRWQVQIITMPWGLIILISVCFLVYCILSLSVKNIEGGSFRLLAGIVAMAMAGVVARARTMTSWAGIMVVMVVMAVAVAGTGALAETLVGFEKGTLLIPGVEDWTVVRIAAWAVVAWVVAWDKSWTWNSAGIFVIVGAIAGGVGISIWKNPSDFPFKVLIGSGLPQLFWSAFMTQIKIGWQLRKEWTKLQVFILQILTATSGIGCGWLMRALLDSSSKNLPL